MSGSPKESRKEANERRAAAQAMRQKQVAKERRQRTLLATVGVVAVLVVIGALVAVGLTNDKHGNSSLLSAENTAAVTKVPTSTLDAIGKGASLAGVQPGYAPVPLTGEPLTENGKPKVLYVGADWCPYCAAARWSMAVALSRFGTFTNLGQVYSAANDGDLASLSFFGSTYTSDYLVFDPNELQDRNHKDLAKLSAANQKLFDTLSDGYPFIDIGGKYKVGSLYNIMTISGMSQDQISSALKDPNSKVAQAIDGSANVMTATICKVTNNQPAAVCDSPGVKAAAAAVPAS